MSRVQQVFDDAIKVKIKDIQPGDVMWWVRKDEDCNVVQSVSVHEDGRIRLNWVPRPDCLNRPVFMAQESCMWIFDLKRERYTFVPDEIPSHA